MDEHACSRLERMDLMPPHWNRDVPTLEWVTDLDYPSRYRGALLGGAAGDALGRPAEARPAEAVAAQYGRITDFQPWSGWTGGPKGTITDDTQLTMVVAENLLAHGDVEPEDLARRLVEWLPVGRGKGQATTAAVCRLEAGVSWWEAGEPSDGNGAAMRAAPVGMAFSTDPHRLRRAAALSAAVTHTGPMAVVGAAVQALAVALVLHTRPGSLDSRAFIKDLGDAAEDLHDPGSFERRRESGNRRVRLIDRIRELPSMLELPPPAAFDRLYNGAFVLESLPSALWCFLRSPDDPEQVIVTAVNGGRDADTVAAMAGTLAGAYVGDAALPDRWLRDLEFVEELRTTADGLYELAVRRRS